MDVWLVGLYVAASLLALRSLVTLMADHKRRYKAELIAEEIAKQKAARKTANADGVDSGSDDDAGIAA